MSPRVEPDRQSAASGRITLGVAGLGLIGGSFALSCKKRRMRVRGWDADPRACAIARTVGAVDSAGCEADILAGCEALLIAVPVRSLHEILGKLTALAGKKPRVWFDAGSTKTDAVRCAAELLGKNAPRFVPCHPVAGAEHSGMSAANASLFAGKTVLVCPEGRDPSAVEYVRSLWTGCGALTKDISAAEHDRLFAFISHLPHVLAYALVGTIGTNPKRDRLLQYAASGFKDFSRIASSDPDMWRDVCISNRDNLLAAMDEFSRETALLRKAVAEGDGLLMRDYFDKVKNLRNGWLASRGE